MPPHSSSLSRGRRPHPPHKRRMRERKRYALLAALALLLALLNEWNRQWTIWGQSRVVGSSSRRTVNGAPAPTHFTASHVQDKQSTLNVTISSSDRDVAGNRTIPIKEWTDNVASRNKTDDNRATLIQSIDNLWGSTTASCRQCPHYNNIIVVRTFCCAGFLDRSYIFRRLAALASYFCAHIYVAPPHHMLWQEHNQGKPIPEALNWSDFLNLTFTDLAAGQTDALVLRQYHSDKMSIDNQNMEFIKSLFHDEEYRDWIRVAFQGNETNQHFHARILNVMERLDLALHAQLVTETEPTVMTALNHSKKANGKGFILEVRREPYKYNKEVLLPFLEARTQNNATKCRIDRIQTNPALTSRIGNQVMEHLQSTFNTTHLGLMHLRRGDQMDVCDTSLEKLAEYLQCGLDGSEIYGNTTILLMTNEVDPCYRQAVMNMVRQLGMGIVDFDQIMLDYIQTQYVAKDASYERLLNSMFQFGAAMTVYWDDPRIKFRFIRRRSQCFSCAQLKEQLSSRNLPLIKETANTLRLRALNVTQVLTDYQACQKKDEKTTT